MDLMEHALFTNDLRIGGTMGVDSEYARERGQGSSSSPAGMYALENVGAGCGKVSQADEGLGSGAPPPSASSLLHGRKFNLPGGEDLGSYGLAPYPKGSAGAVQCAPVRHTPSQNGSEEMIIKKTTTLSIGPDDS